LPPPSPEHRRAAAAQFEKANQVVATGNYDYGIHLLLSCCKLDPGVLQYRQRLRQTEKMKYRNNLRGHWLAWLTTLFAKARLRSAKGRGDHLAVLEHGEQVLLRNPWDVGTQMRMAESADALGLLDLAVWSLEQARQKSPKDPHLNRALATLYEKRGNFSQAIALWAMVRKAWPHDVEAQDKARHLAASETIARGHYEEAIEQATARAAPADKPRSGPIARQTPPPPGTTDRLSRDAMPVVAQRDADPTNPLVHLRLSGIYRRAGQFDRAREVLVQGLGPTGNAFELTAELADLEIEPFRRDLSIAEEKLRATPDDAELQRLRARLEKEIQTRELDLFRRKADRFPTEMGHRLEVGVRLFKLGQVDEAIKELQAVRNDARCGWRALYHLGHCFQARSNARLALRNFEEAMQQLPASEAELRKELLYLLARGAADVGDLSRALDRGHDLAHLDFGYRDIGRLIDEWEQRRAEEEKPRSGNRV
jgi:tetratricopeptide (TPR) repeat protein